MYSAGQLLALGASLAICAVAVLYADFFAALLPSAARALSADEQAQVIASLVLHTEEAHREQQQTGDAVPRLAFCCSADLDVSVPAVELMGRVQRVEKEQFALHSKKKKKAKKDQQQHHHGVYEETLAREHHERIGSLRDLQESFAFYFSNGAAAEQSMSSPEQFREVVKFANEIPSVKRKVGGNAATMADRAAVEGCKVLLGAAIGKEMRKHFNADIQLVGHLESHEQEDVHLVLEYAKGDMFRGHESPRANRYYLNHDIYNARLSVLEEFEQALDTFGPDLVVFGGLQLMEVETDEDRRLARLTTLSSVLQNLFVKQVPTHYEFAAVSGESACAFFHSICEPESTDHASLRVQTSACSTTRCGSCSRG
jgi:ADP-dependent glucokinase